MHICCLSRIVSSVGLERCFDRAEAGGSSPPQSTVWEKNDGMEVKIDPSWKAVLQPAFERASFHNLVMHLKTERATGQVIYPPGSLLFNAFNKTPFGRVKVVILGQDPYHGAGQAMGLSFSVPKGIQPPPSLINIFKELKADIGLKTPGHGDLTHWAGQGVLLLNASLTVRALKTSAIWAETTRPVQVVNRPSMNSP